MRARLLNIALALALLALFLSGVLTGLTRPERAAVSPSYWHRLDELRPYEDMAHYNIENSISD